MKGSKKISVITVCYNAVDVIEKTIQSVLSQNYDNLEYIIIDGGSTDGTVDIIKRYSESIDYWHSKPDKGIYDAMNKGIQVATGDFLNFMNAGDKFSDKDTITQVASYCDKNLIAIYGACRKIYISGKSSIEKPRALNKLLTDMPFCHQSVFINVKYHKSHLFNISFRYSADYDFFYHAWKNGCLFKKIECVIADYRFGDGMSMMNFQDTILERENSWTGEKNTLLRKIKLRYYVLKIKLIRAIKTIL